MRPLILVFAWCDAHQGRSSSYHSRASVEPGDDEEHQAESLFCVCLQRTWCTDCGGGVVPFLRLALESDDRCRSNERQFGFRSGECFAATKSAHLANEGNGLVQCLKEFARPWAG